MQDLYEQQYGSGTLACYIFGSIGTLGVALAARICRNSTPV